MSTEEHTKRAAFLTALAETCNVSRACERASLPRPTAYAWRKADEAFAAEWDDALTVGVGALEDEAHRRAFEGVEKPVYHAGKPVGAIREYSDTLAIFLLKAHRPEKYRERHDVNMKAQIATSDMTDEELLAEMAELAAKGFLPAVAAALLASAQGEDLV